MIQLGAGALSARAAAIILLTTSAAITAVAETRMPSITGTIVPVTDGLMFLVALYAIVRVAMPAANGFWQLPWQKPSVAIVLAILGSLIAGWVGGVAWPNSGDEYSYAFLADMLRAGRLWVPAPADPELFTTFHILVRDGRVFSPYPPAWSAYLMPFRQLGVVCLANPLLTGVLGIALAGACERLKLDARVQRAGLALVLLTPFTMFLGGSLFPQTQAAALTAAIVWTQLADEEAPCRRYKLLIGVLFGLLLLTRYEVFAIVALIYGIDRLALRRFGAIPDGMLVLAGVLPFAICLTVYNAGITGDPLRSTLFWGQEVAPTDDTAVLGGHLAAAAFHNLFWAGSLAQFGGLPVAFLAVVGLAAKLRRRTCRFYDFLFPAAVVFYSFMPFTGGHQYGPRYLFWAWPIAVLTILSAPVHTAGSLRFGGRRVAFEGFAAACLTYSAGAFLVLLVTTRLYIDARREVFKAAPPDVPAIVLLPDRQIKLWPWQIVSIPASNLDFTRNGIRWNGDVLYGRGDVHDAVVRACHLSGRHVYRWVGREQLQPVACP